MSKRKFDRLAPDDRCDELIEATLRCLMREGREGLSTRKISSEAGISVGLINHHFHSKDDLVAAAYTKLAERQLIQLKQKAKSAGPRAEDRLKGFIRAYFGPEIMDRNVLRAWIVFWGMSFESKQIRATHDRNDAMFREFLEPLLVEAHGGAEFDPRSHAIELNALLDGLWVEWCLDTNPFDAEEGRLICERWIDRFLST